MSLELSQLVAYLNQYLNVADVPDDQRALNGLQVENGGTVSRVAAAVDACQASIDAAAEAGADLLLVHHGLFWGGLEPIVGRHARRLRSLWENGIAVYASHLPLDWHPEVGNNAVLARDLGLASPEPFGQFEGTAIGRMGSVDTTRDSFVARVRERLGVEPRVIPGGSDRLRRVGLVTGGASSALAEARDAGLDTFVTGEGPHHTYHDAMEWGINLIYAGHYATETVGVRALAAHLEGEFGLPWVFVDHPTGL